MGGYSDVSSIIANAGGIARTADFNKAGYANHQVSYMCKIGLISRVRNGYYTMPLPQDDDANEEEVIARLYPDGIICMDSALFYYGYSDKTPLEWHLAFPRTVTRTRFDNVYPPVRWYMVKDDIFEMGKDIGAWGDTTLLIYNRERIICDCFKRRTELDSETFSKAVNAYAADDKKNLSRLSEYAKKLRVYGKVTEIMEVLLNG